MPVSSIDKILAEIFERRAVQATIPPIQQPVTMSKEHWQPKKAGNRKYLPKPPLRKLVAVKQVTKPQRNRYPTKPKLEDNGGHSPHPEKPSMKTGSDQKWPEEGRMEWFPQPARFEQEYGEENDEMTGPWEPMEEEQEEWPEEETQ